MEDIFFGTGAGGQAKELVFKSDAAAAAFLEGLLAGRLQAELAVEGKASLVASEAAHRALQIAQRMSPKLPGSKKAELPSRVAETLEALYRNAIDERAFVVFGRAAELGLYYQLIDPAEVARDAEAVAFAGTGAYAMAIKSVWDLGVRVYRQLDDADGMRRCQLGALDQILAMRSEVSSAAAEASWVMDALRPIDALTPRFRRPEEQYRSAPDGRGSVRAALALDFLRPESGLCQALR